MRTHVIYISLVLLAFTPRAAADFAPRDHDTLVFMGDSITAARGYSKTIDISL